MCDACVPVDPTDTSTDPFSDDDTDAIATFSSLILGMLTGADVAIDAGTVKAPDMRPVVSAAAALTTTLLMMPTDGDEQPHPFAAACGLLINVVGHVAPEAPECDCGAGPAGHRHTVSPKIAAVGDDGAQVRDLPGNGSAVDRVWTLTGQVTAAVINGDGDMLAALMAATVQPGMPVKVWARAVLIPVFMILARTFRNVALEGRPMDELDERDG